MSTSSETEILGQNPNLSQNSEPGRLLAGGATYEVSNTHVDILNKLSDLLPPRLLAGVAWSEPRTCQQRTGPRNRYDPLGVFFFGA